MMKKTLLLLFISIFFITFLYKKNNEEVARLPSQVERSVEVAVVDFPLDYEYPMISRSLDSEIMKKILVESDEKEPIGLYELNQEMMKKMKEKVKLKDYQDHNFLLNWAHLTPAEKKKNWIKLVRILFKYHLNPKFRRGIVWTSLLRHGTAVSGIIISKSSSVKLINIPYAVYKDKDSIEELLRFDEEKYFEASDRFFRNLSKTLSESNVKVVNISMGTSFKRALEELNDDHNFLIRNLFRKRFKKIAKVAAKRGRGNLNNLVKAHPEIVFVKSAGNEGFFLEDLDLSWSSIKHPNLVIVGSVDKSNRIESFSNRSNEYVTIAAEGKSVESILAFGGKTKFTGTSLSAPLVTSALVDIFERSPNLSSLEAVNLLYSKLSEEVPFLFRFIERGRVLKTGKALRQCLNELELFGY